jgi:hypothetical protein
MKVERIYDDYNLKATPPPFPPPVQIMAEKIGEYGIFQIFGRA